MAALELNLLAEFALLARHLHYNRTARELNLTQPTLSRHIVQLEEELGVQLFRRDRQSVALTEAGKLFLPEAEAVLARYDAARRRLQEYRDEMAGSITIGYRWIYNGGIWPDVLQAFRVRYPNTTVRLISYQDTSVLPDAVRDGSLDVAIVLRADNVLPSEFRGLVLRGVPLVAAMREDHPLARKEVVLPVELVRERLLVPQTRSSMGFPARMSALFCVCGLTPTIIYSRERLEEALLRVQFDDLVALVPQCYFPDTPVPGLRVIQVGGSTGLFYLMAIARSDTPNSAVQMFLRVCRAQLKEECLAEKLEHLPE